MNQGGDGSIFLCTSAVNGTTFSDDPEPSLPAPLAVFLPIPQEDKTAVDSLAKVATTVMFEFSAHDIYAAKIGCS